MAAADPPYVGRFAPSPTGPLHQGSLICALASFLDARHAGGRWLLRMEDLDPPREPPGAATSILQGLRDHGLYWDGDVVWQSQRHTAYAAAVQDLMQRRRAFACDCTRQQLAREGGIYLGHCRERGLPLQAGHSIRLRTDAADTIQIHDLLQPMLEQNVSSAVGDFVILRKDQLYAYQIAVVVDDAWQGITHVVRGSDLYPSTPRQVLLQGELGLPTPIFAHIPVITNRQGQKLSKQTHAPALQSSAATQNLRRALEFLRQPTPPPGLNSPSAIVAHAARHWDLAAIPGSTAIPDTYTD
ncbi:tRNA glutamyl-Q(34) synthetase GluQRS [Halieaceae bacterium IMCC14734]|uniref:Glutamyl-Q tRNA(Asp) synthetase n=1 Tax=Candidatus Litorirhabdus singularis TaxID=2518993 RepID=A0ABT3TM38_9GAMM|nr:tRNA glutamyl-Q(34) synthetase GluQRS [Candidatus Litorirhabdus singularis]MCX2983089.1 tRNA glutamyl-Q(34) synthetase GluQRS [Candidatus Litorirhabdus singularis]